MQRASEGSTQDVCDGETEAQAQQVPQPSSPLAPERRHPSTPSGHLSGGSGREFLPWFLTLFLDLVTSQATVRWTRKRKVSGAWARSGRACSTRLRRDLCCVRMLGTGPPNACTHTPSPCSSSRPPLGTCHVPGSLVAAERYSSKLQLSLLISRGTLAKLYCLIGQKTMTSMPRGRCCSRNAWRIVDGR